MILNGVHLVADFKDVEWGILDNEERLKDILFQACKVGNLTVLTGNSWKFEPQGVTCYYVLSESHISIHTAPELGTAHVDIYHCGNNGNVYVALKHIKEQLGGHYDVTILQR